MRLLLLLVTLLVSFHARAQCDHPDYDALMALYNSTDGDNWIHNDGWKEGKEGTSCDPCEWQGVSCTFDRVSRLLLANFGLNGTLPDLQLSELKTFSVWNNQLSGTIPDFSGIPLLTYLTLVKNKFTGAIPNFSNLPLLIEFYACENQFNAPLPPFNMCQNLEWIEIQNSQLTGPLPEFELPVLKNLFIKENNIDGPLPELKNCPRLSWVIMSDNQLSGPVPDWCLPSLFSLDLGNNNLTGNITVLSGCPSLSSYRLSYNQLTGEFPDFSGLPNLDLLWVEANHNFLSGCFPETICDIGNVILQGNYDMPFQGETYGFCNDGDEQIGSDCGEYIESVLSVIQEDCSCQLLPCDEYHPDMEMLMTLYNALDGENWEDNRGWTMANRGFICNPCLGIGAGNRRWPGVHCENDRVVCLNLDVLVNCVGKSDGNNLSGEIPKLVSDKLETLRLSNNNITGPFLDLKGLTALKVLDLSGNQLEGPISNLEYTPNLTYLNFAGNNLDGEFPTLNMPHLEYFDLTGNNFSGAFNISNSTQSLETMRIDSNQFSGLFPAFIMPELREMSIGNNNFEGPIPDFGWDWEALTKLEVYAQNNNFSGCFPEEKIVQLCAIKKMELEGNTELPWFGEKFYKFCNEENQIGAPCGEEVDGFPSYIHSDCECSALCETTHPDLEMLMTFYDALNGENWDNFNGWSQAKAGYICDPCVHFDFIGPWAGVHCNEQGRVVCIDMDGVGDCTLVGISGNNLKGEIPDLHFEYLETLILDGNNLSGNGIPDLSNMPRLKSLSMSQCQLEGTIPDFSEASQLVSFRGSYNLLRGTLPDLSHMDSLSVFTVFGNQLTGCFPENICEIEVFDARENFEMPWFGDHTLFCEGESQIGAPCTDADMNDDFAIDENCVCSMIMISSADQVSDSEIQIYPNPVSQELFITGIDRGVKYTITNIDGQQNLIGTISNQSIDLDGLNQGTYFIKIIDSVGELVVRRFLKM